MTRFLAALAILLLAPALLAQSPTEERSVSIDLQDGTHVDGRLIDFGMRTYRIRIGDKVVEIPESQVSEIRFRRSEAGAATVDTGAVAAALTTLEKEIEVDPAQAAAALQRFRHVLGLDDSRHELAFRAIERARAQFEAGMSSRNAYDAALQDFQKALALDPARTDATRRAFELAQKAIEAVRTPVAGSAGKVEHEVRESFFRTHALPLQERWRVDDPHLIGCFADAIDLLPEPAVVTTGILDPTPGASEGKAYAVMRAAATGRELGPLFRSATPLLGLARASREWDRPLVLGGLENFMAGCAEVYAPSGERLLQVHGARGLARAEIVPCERTGNGMLVAGEYGGGLHAFAADGRELWNAAGRYYDFCVDRSPQGVRILAARGWADAQAPRGAIDVFDADGKRLPESCEAAGIGFKAVTIATAQSKGLVRTVVVGGGSRTESGDGADVVMVFDGAASMTFDLPPGFILRQPNALAAGDLDGDGNDEIVVALSPGVLNREGHGVHDCFLCVLSLDGKPLWVSEAIPGAGAITVGSFAAGLQVADLELDGRKEIVLGVMNQGVRVYGLAPDGATARTPESVRGAFRLECDAPELLADVLVGADGKAILPLCGESLQVEGKAKEILAAEIAGDYRALGLPSGLLQKVALDAATASGIELQSTPLPSGAVMRAEVEGHPEWSVDFETTAGETAVRTIPGLGELEIRKDSTWGQVMLALRKLVAARDRQRTVWLRRLPTPRLPRVSMIAALDEVVSSQAADDASAVFGRGLSLNAERIRLNRANGSLADLARFEAALNRSGRLRAALREAVPMDDSGGKRSYGAMIEGTLQDTTLPAWAAAERRRRAGNPEAVFQVGALLPRLEEIATKGGLTLGPVQGEERKIGGALTVTLTGPTLAALRDGLRAIEGLARNSCATDVMLESVATSRGAEWKVKAAIALGYPDDPFAGIASAAPVVAGERVTFANLPFDQAVSEIARVFPGNLSITAEAAALARGMVVNCRDLPWRTLIAETVTGSGTLAVDEQPGGMMVIRKK